MIIWCFWTLQTGCLDAHQQETSTPTDRPAGGRGGGSPGKQGSSWPSGSLGLIRGVRLLRHEHPKGWIWSDTAPGRVPWLLQPAMHPHGSGAGEPHAGVRDPAKTWERVLTEKEGRNFVSSSDQNINRERVSLMLKVVWRKKKVNTSKGFSSWGP